MNREWRDLYDELGMLAMNDGHAVTVEYTHTTKTEGLHRDLRTLSGLHLYVRNGIPYVRAFCDKAQERRTFRVDRIEVVCLYERAGFAAQVGERN